MWTAGHSGSASDDQLLDFGRKRLFDNALDRSALNDNGNRIHSTGELNIKATIPAGTLNPKQSLLAPTPMQRQTQMLLTDTGPTVGDTARSYMRGGS